MKKYGAYILILLVLVGVFTPVFQVYALQSSTDNTAFQIEVDKYACGWPSSDWTPTLTVGGCLLHLFDFIIHQLPFLILWVVAYVFNVLINITLYTTLFTQSAFIPQAWGIVRDLSNIFFILILLYIAVRLILGLGGHEVKKMIAHVVIMALLINFSMFITEVVIDTSNILALIFYNKISVSTGTPPRPYASVNGEKDVAGGLVSAFDPTTTINEDVFKQAKRHWDPQPPYAEDPTPYDQVPVSMMLLLMVVAGIIACVAIYALFIAGISFVGRLVELWAIIIFSPFAFMSSTIPLLSHVEYIGWDEWVKKLLSIAFMAPIFMFFLYLIFMLIHADIFKTILGSNTGESGLLSILLGVGIPAMIILKLLLKATDFAKKGGGEFAAMAMTGLKVAGGLALGAATGGAALAATGTLGKMATSVANNAETRRLAAGGEGISTKEQKSAQRKLALANSVAGKSFDFRQSSLGKFAASKTGMDFNKGTSVLGLDTKKFEKGRTGIEKAQALKADETRKTYMLTTAGARDQDEKAKQRDARIDQYSKDLNTAKETTEAKNNPEMAVWEQKLESALAQNKLLINPVNEDILKEDYLRDNPKPTEKLVFNESAFKKAYETGGNLKDIGLDKEIAGGGLEKIRNSKEENTHRQDAYGVSLSNAANDEDGKLTATRKAMSRFYDNFSSAAGESVANTSKATIATSLAAGAATGGVGLAVGAGAIAAKAVYSGFANAFKEQMQGEGKKGTNAELVAKVRKGVPTSIEDALHHLDEARGVGHDGGHGDAHGKEDKGHGDAHGGGHEEKHEEAHAEEHHEPAPAADHGGGGGDHGGDHGGGGHH